MNLEQLSQIATIVIGLILTTVALRVGQGVLLPLVLALLIYALVLPAIDLLRLKWKFPRWVALLLSVLICLVVATTGFIFCFLSISNFSIEATTYHQRIHEIVSLIQGIGLRWGLKIDVARYFANFDSEKIWDWGQLVTGNILTLVSYAALVAIYLIFLLLGKSRNDRWPRPLVQVQASMSRYIWVKTLLAATMAAIVGILLWILGAELTLLFGFLTFFLNFIPSLGSALSVLLPLPVLWLQYGFGAEFWVFLGVAGAAQVYVGNILEPSLMGRSMDLHPVTVMFFLVFWSFVWGIAGAFLAVPLTVILKTTLETIPATKRLAMLMSGRLAE
ncbi:MAG: AI-2E family transporter [Bdellovibrionota bacterium]